MKKTYLLYEDDTKTELLSMQFNLKEAKEDSLNYSFGQWFSYEQDSEDMYVMYADTEKKINIKFGTKIEKKEESKEKDTWIDDSVSIR